MLHSVENEKKNSHRKQKFVKFSKTVTFTKFLPKKCECELHTVEITEIYSHAFLKKNL